MKKFSAFTLIELITAIAIICVLTGIVLAIAGFANQRGAMVRARSEIRTFETACERYKADNGVYPRDTRPAAVSLTDTLSPKKHFHSATVEYADAGKVLYKELSGDKKGLADDDPDGVPENGEKVYIPDLDRRTVKVDRDKNDKNKIIKVYYFQDPWGNPYGYSTAAAREEEEFQTELRQGRADSSRKSGADLSGFNASSFDMWSTAASKPKPLPANDQQRELAWAKWATNW